MYRCAGCQDMRARPSRKVSLETKYSICKGRR